MFSLSTTVARHRIFYPRPILAMPDILMIDMPAEFRSPSLPLGHYHPILIETVAEQHELEAYLEEECQVPPSPDLLDARPSAHPADHITVAHYGPPFENWRSEEHTSELQSLKRNSSVVFWLQKKNKH